MLSNSSCFTPFSEQTSSEDVSSIELPEKFTFPFYYEAHPLCKIAAHALQDNLLKHELWAPYFNIDSPHSLPKDGDIQNNGKMFGVLIVKNKKNELGYLSAFSGKNPFEQPLADFVPPVPSNNNPHSTSTSEPAWFAESTLVINQINNQIEALEATPEITSLTQIITKKKIDADSAISAHKVLMKAAKKSRNQKRDEAEKHLNKEAYIALKKELSIESIQYKNKLRDLNAFWQEHIEQDEASLAVYTDKIEALKTERKRLSTQLQHAIFNQYQFLNAQGEAKGLVSLFEQTITPEPPSGSGDCAAPKLLQYAYTQQLTPIAMAEFWWGAAPKSEIRQHKNFYSACQNKCKPILSHMLQGLEVEDNPLLINPAQGKLIDYLYEDDNLVVINKPAEFLSVPGKDISDSVYMRIKEKYPHATGSIIVHRLDMSTSGIMVLALNARTHKGLQKQFIERTVAKRYVALVENSLAGANSKQVSKQTLEQVSGTINLPLRVDLSDRPRQLVCYEHGKSAETYWEVINSNNDVSSGKAYTRLYLHPKTGRTHQLRVHCAHPLGLNSPIVGDDLYGTKARRLHLHAQHLSFEHPITREPMEFTVEPDF